MRGGFDISPVGRGNVSLWPVGIMGGIEGIEPEGIMGGIEGIETEGIIEGMECIGIEGIRGVVSEVSLEEPVPIVFVLTASVLVISLE